MRLFVSACAFAGSLILMNAGDTALASEAAAAAPAKAAYTTEDTDIGTLLDDPAARAILDKRVPTVSKGENIDMARSMTLRALQQYAPEVLTDQVLKDIDADLAKLPAK